MTTEEKSLTVQDADYTNGDLMPLGTLMDQRQIVALGDNLMGVHPQAKEIGKVGMRTVAQLALMTGANPLPGTNGIHPWVDNKGKLCIQFGIGFWRGEIEKRGGFMWVDRPRLMTDEERAMWGVEENEVGFICRGTTWEAVKRLRREEKELGGDISLKEAREMLYKEGVGIVGRETWGSSGNYKEQKTGRSLFWTAAERCERDLCRKLAPIFTPGQQNAETKRLSSGPAWDGLDRHDQDFNPETVNEELFGQQPEPAVYAEFEELESAAQPEPDNEPERATEPEPTQEPEETAETDNDLAGIIADCRSWLQEKIKDDLVELGLVMDAAAMTPLFDNWQQAHNALTEYDFPEGFKLNRKQTVYGKPALTVFDWLVSRKVDTAE